MYTTQTANSLGGNSYLPYAYRNLPSEINPARETTHPLAILAILAPHCNPLPYMLICLIISARWLPSDW
jgi:hypothetical protein